MFRALSKWAGMQVATHLIKSLTEFSQARSTSPYLWDTWFLCFLCYSVEICYNYNKASFGTMLTPSIYRFSITRLHMLRELEEAVQRKFHVPPDVSDTTSVANGWESRLHISQVWNNIGSTLILVTLNLIFFMWIHEYHICELRRKI